MDVEQQKQQLFGLMAVAEEHQKAADAALKGLNKAVVTLDAAPEKLARTLESSFQKLDEERQALQQERRVDRQNLVRWFWAAVFSAFALVGTAVALLLHFYIWPAIDESKAYARDHRALEASSVFGANLIENSNGNYVMFDEGVRVKGGCIDFETKEPIPNCASLMRE